MYCTRQTKKERQVRQKWSNNHRVTCSKWCARRKMFRIRAMPVVFFNIYFSSTYRPFGAARSPNFATLIFFVLHVVFDTMHRSVRCALKLMLQLLRAVVIIVVRTYSPQYGVLLTIGSLTRNGREPVCDCTRARQTAHLTHTGVVKSTSKLHTAKKLRARSAKHRRFISASPVTQDLVGTGTWGSLFQLFRMDRAWQLCNTLCSIRVTNFLRVMTCHRLRLCTQR